MPGPLYSFPSADAAASSRPQTASLQEIFEADPGALAVLVGPELRFAFANPAYRALLPAGVDPLGRTYASMWPHEPMRAVEERLRAALAAPGPIRTDREERVCGDGLRRVFTSQACPIRWEGEPAVLAVLWETTPLEDARRQVERHAQEAERRAAELQAIFDAIPDALALSELNGRIVAANAEYERVLQLRPEERSRSIHDRWSAFSIEDAQGRPVMPEELPVSRALAGEVVRDLEMRFQRRDDPASSVTWVTGSAAPLRDASGTAYGAVATYTDITRLHELREEREDLFRMVTHDLRSPLMAILLHAQQLARSSGSSEQAQRKARSIHTSARRMESMIAEMADLVRVESGPGAFAPVPVEVTGAVQDLLSRLGESVAVERVRVHGGAVHALVDPASLDRVLVNLITNAVKYSPAKEPVDVRVEGRGAHVAVAVVDRGPGIDPAEQRHIFQRFYRRARDARSEGLGLGLYITRMLVERMGGHIEVASAPGKGSAFTVTLPAAADPSPHHPSAPG
jgi:PAS domain S-box-containing protein